MGFKFKSVKKKQGITRCAGFSLIQQLEALDLKAAQRFEMPVNMGQF